MELYANIVDKNRKQIIPDFDFSGELIQHVLMKDRYVRAGNIIIDENYRLPRGAKFITTSFLKEDMYKIFIYINGKKITSKRVDLEKTVFYESNKLIEAIIMDINLGYYECN